MNRLIDLYCIWFKMGLFTFGGGYAMLPMIQREVIEKRKWATEEEILDYYAIGQCTPGIIAVNTATFVGLKLEGIAGGIVATLGVVSPSLVIILLIAGLIDNFQDIAIVQSAIKGINIGVCVLMSVAIYSMFKSNVKTISGVVLFVIFLLLTQFTNTSMIILVVSAGLCGVVLNTMKEKKK